MCAFERSEKGMKFFMEDRYTSKVVVILVLTREIDNKLQILLQRRCNTGYMDGLYDMACSGHLEKGETLASALLREAKEEIGIDIKESDLNLVAVNHQYKNDYIHFFFKTDKYTGTPKIMEEEKCDDLSWFDLNNLPDNMISSARNSLVNIINNINYDDYDFSNQKRLLKENKI